MDDSLAFAVKIAIQAGELLKNFYHPSGITATMKSDRTVVTEADLAADKLITAAIHTQYPQAEIISEESAYQVKDGEAPTWIIDPLDGSTNFSLGLLIWGISIAKVVNGYTELGVAYFPMIQELYSTRRGNGAYLNNQAIQVKSPDPAQPMSFFSCDSRTFRNYDIRIPYKPRILGSSAYSFCMLARGSALVAFDATPKLWDLAAVWLLVKEAGGTIETIEDNQPFPLAPQNDYRKINYPTLAAATPEVHSSSRKKIIKKAST